MNSEALGIPADRFIDMEVRAGSMSKTEARVLGALYL